VIARASLRQDGLQLLAVRRVQRDNFVDDVEFLRAGSDANLQRNKTKVGSNLSARKRYECAATKGGHDAGTDFASAERRERAACYNITNQSYGTCQLSLGSGLRGGNTPHCMS
jgi:hypothetical protein